MIIIIIITIIKDYSNGAAFQNMEPYNNHDKRENCCTVYTFRINAFFLANTTA